MKLQKNDNVSLQTKKQLTQKLNALVEFIKGTNQLKRAIKQKSIKADKATQLLKELKNKFKIKLNASKKIQTR